jgi:uncharacterized membrane protein YcjF (UPF0283 family)
VVSRRNGRVLYRERQRRSQAVAYVLNGLLTARFGLAAIDIIRPLPFAALPRPTLRDLMSEVLGSFGNDEERRRSPESNLAITEVQ